MKLMLTGVYRFTFHSIKKELSMRVKHDIHYKDSLRDLADMFKSMEDNHLDISADFTDPKEYAESIAQSLTRKKHPYLIKSSLMIASAILTIGILFVITTLAFTIKIRLDNPVIEYNNDTISWNRIEHAHSYTVLINNSSFTTTETSFDFTPTEYGLFSITVYANKPGFFYQQSRFSNTISHEVSPIALDEPILIYPNDINAIETNSIGDAKIQFEVAHSGKFKVNMFDVESLNGLTLKIYDVDSSVYLSDLDNYTYMLQTYNTYVLELHYQRNHYITFTLEPETVSLNNTLFLDSFTNAFYNVNTALNNDQYITLLDYQNSIQINNLRVTAGYPGIPYGTLSWMNPQFEVFNQTSMNREFELIKKSTNILNNQEKYTLSERNQVEVFKVVVPYSCNILYAEYDSDYYDIYWMDEHLTQLSNVALESSTTFISIPLVHLTTFRNVYAILVPKDNKIVGTTTIEVSFTKPETGTYWPYV